MITNQQSDAILELVQAGRDVLEEQIVRENITGLTIHSPASRKLQLALRAFDELDDGSKTEALVQTVRSFLKLHENAEGLTMNQFIAALTSLKVAYQALGRGDL
ncbi:MAG TPA: hypothetical protein VF905_01695 [Nitrospirota bacterium]